MPLQKSLSLETFLILRTDNNVSLSDVCPITNGDGSLAFSMAISMAMAGHGQMVKVVG